MDLLVGRKGGIDPLEKAKKFLMTMPAMTGADDFSSSHIECRKQGSGTVPDVIVCLTLRHSGPQRQDWTRTVKSLNLTLLVDTKDDGAVRRIEIKPDDIAYLFYKERVG